LRGLASIFICAQSSSEWQRSRCCIADVSSFACHMGSVSLQRSDACLDRKFEAAVSFTWLLRVMHLMLAAAWVLPDWAHYRTRRRCPTSSMLEFAGRLDTSRSQYSFHRRTGPSRRPALGMFADIVAMSRVFPSRPMCLQPLCKQFLCTSFSNCLLHVLFPCTCCAIVQLACSMAGQKQPAPKPSLPCQLHGLVGTCWRADSRFSWNSLLFLGGVAPAAAGVVQVIPRPPATRA